VKRRRSNTLVALSSVAVMSVYTAGFMRTRAAAARLEGASRVRIPVLPSATPAPAAPPVAMMAPVEAPAAPVVRENSPKPAATKTAQPAARTAETKEPEPGLTATAIATPSTTPEPVTPPPPAAKPDAPVPAVTTPAPAAPAASMSPSAEILLGGTELHDGTFLGWGTSRHGDIQASVTILSGRITAVSIAQCRTRYSCDVIAHLPAKVLKDQTPEKINNVSGATQSVDAFYYAVVDAMNKAK
jgi:uncharacterized protein with FMN-binding domain